MIKRLQAMKLPLALATLAAAGAIAAAASIADEPQERHGRQDHWGRAMLTTMDADKDGTITSAEIEAHQAARAAEIDADKNGTITVEEMIAHEERMRAQRTADRLKSMDRDGDGNVSVDEYEAARTWRLARLDRNGDGRIEPDEMRFHGGKRHHH